MIPHEPPSLFLPGRNCHVVAKAGRVALLIDGDAYFSAFMQAAELARHSILILAWDFSSAARLHFAGSRHDPPARLGDFLNWLARRRHDLRIRVLDWDYPMVFGTDREIPPPGWGFGWKAHPRVELAYDNTHPVGGSHHQKIVVIDDAMAFVGGFDLTDRRWDTPRHSAGDRRRMAGGVPYPPFHDLMMAVDGEAAQALGEMARDRWLAATGESLAPIRGAALWPSSLPVDLCDVDVALARTMPPEDGWPAVREVEALYLDMIAAARQRIYIENQYFTADRIAAALAERLADPEGPEVVIVLRLLSHGWLEEHTMHVLRTELIRRLREADRHGRFFLYYAHQEGLKPGTCIDVHAKLMIIDDEMLRIGSANLCRRSLGMDSECDAAIEARGDPEVSAVISGFRDRLIGEHLDVPPQRVAEEARRLGSLHGAIQALSGRARTLRPFEQLDEWPDPVIDLVRMADPAGPAVLGDLIEAIAVPGLPQAQQRKHMVWRLAAFVGVILGLMALWRFTPLAHYVEPRLIAGWAREFAGRPWAPLLVVALYTPACVVMFPRQLITLGAVVAFGPTVGAAYALGGTLLAAYLTYLAGRRLPRRVVRRAAGHQLNRMVETLRRRGLLAVTALRLVPLAPFAVEGLVAGAVRIRLWHFMLGTFFGLLPGTFVATVFGREIGGMLEKPSEFSFGLIAVAVAVMLALTLLVRRWLMSESRHTGEGGHVPAGH